MKGLSGGGEVMQASCDLFGAGENNLRWRRRSREAAVPKYRAAFGDQDPMTFEERSQELLGFAMHELAPGQSGSARISELLNSSSPRVKLESDGASERRMLKIFELVDGPLMTQSCCDKRGIAGPLPGGECSACTPWDPEEREAPQDPITSCSPANSEAVAEQQFVSSDAKPKEDKRKRKAGEDKGNGRDASYRARLSAIRKKLWQDPEYRLRVISRKKVVNKDVEYRRKLSEAQKRLWSDPERRRKVTEARSLAEPERRRQISEAMKKHWQDPQYRQRLSESMKTYWRDPENRRRRKLGKDEP